MVPTTNALFSTSGENGFIEIHSDPGANTWEFHANTRSSSSADQLWFRQHYTGSSPKGDATCRIQLLNGYMTRRTIKAPIVRIHTADDDYLQANAASLHEAIKPEISLIAGKGGTTADGSRIYNNSQVKVTRETTPAPTPLPPRPTANSAANPCSLARMTRPAAIPRQPQMFPPAEAAH